MLREGSGWGEGLSKLELRAQVGVWVARFARAEESVRAEKFERATKFVRTAKFVRAVWAVRAVPPMRGLFPLRLTQAERR